MRIKNFENEDSITLEWDADSGADEYILYRDTDPYGSFSQIVYHGTELSFTDKNIEGIYTDDLYYFYYYKLAKKRESKEFDKSTYVVGGASDVMIDQYEDNDKQNNAKPFNNPSKANIYYYKDGNQNELVDTDWYSIELDPRTMVTLTVKNMQNIINTYDPSTNTGFSELCYQEMRKTETINVYEGRDNIILINNEYESKTKYFKISINKADFSGEDGTPLSMAGRGGKFGYYEIHFVNKVNID